MEQQFALETEHGRVFVSESEFNDVQARYDGAYGADWKLNPQRDEMVFHVEQDDEGTLVGSARVWRKAIRPVTLSPFELEIQAAARAGDTRKILELAQRLI